MTPLVRARLGFALGCLLLVAGVFVLLGLGAALIVAGVLVAGSFLVLTDVDGKGGGDR